MARTICFFSKDLQWLDYDALAETFAEAGLDGVDLTVRPGGHVLPERVTEELPRAVEAARNAGLEIPMMTTAITDANDPATAPILQTASGLGIRYYRMGYLSYDPALGVAGSLQAFEPRMRALAAMNQRYGIHGAYQNHAGTRVGGPVWISRCCSGISIRSGWAASTISDTLPSRGRSPGRSAWIWSAATSEPRWSRISFGPGMKAAGASRMCHSVRVWWTSRGIFALVKEHGITGPISLHIEYPILSSADEALSLEQRRRKAVVVLRRDVEWLRGMLAEAALS